MKLLDNPELLKQLPAIDATSTEISPLIITALGNVLFHFGMSESKQLTFSQVVNAIEDSQNYILAVSGCCLLDYLLSTDRSLQTLLIKNHFMMFPLKSLSYTFDRRIEVEDKHFLVQAIDHYTECIPKFLSRLAQAGNGLDILMYFLNVNNARVFKEYALSWLQRLIESCGAEIYDDLWKKGIVGVLVANCYHPGESCAESYEPLSGMHQRLVYEILIRLASKNNFIAETLRSIGGQDLFERSKSTITSRDLSDFKELMWPTVIIGEAETVDTGYNRVMFYCDIIEEDTTTKDVAAICEQLIEYRLF